MPSRKMHLLFILFVFIASGTISVLAAGSDQNRQFTIDDYFSVKRIIDLSLSSDGAMIAYAVESQSLKENKTIRTIYISTTEVRAKPVVIETIQDARRFAWIPGQHELAFLSRRDGTAQVYSLNVKSGKIHQHTHSEINVTAFKFAPSGSVLAFITQERPNIDLESFYTSKYDGPYDRLHNGESGTVVDFDRTGLYDFLDSNHPNFNTRRENRLWLKRNGKNVTEALVPGRVEDFHWSSSGVKLSIRYVDDNIGHDAFFNNLTSLGALNIGLNIFEAVAHAYPPTEIKRGKYFTGGEWVPGQDLIHVRRIVERDAWFKSADWTLFNVTDGGELDEHAATWHSIEKLDSDKFIPVDASHLYFSKTVNAVNALFKFESDGLVRADILRGVIGTAAHFEFSADFQHGAFVHEDLTTPAEIFIWHDGDVARQLTHLNDAIAGRKMPVGREITWKSGGDGKTVHGWLLEPKSPHKDKPTPLITFVHGGPGLPMQNQFSYYFWAYGGVWPYPFEVYALNGFSVFLPNYRGTVTYGDEFRDPKNIDGEAVDDITSGIEYLVQQGVADPDRLGLSGHSHGAWLAPLVMTRSNQFRAGSFAEGGGNMVTVYDLMPGRLNRVTHDVVFGDGASLYEDPQRYIDLSPTLHFRGLNTAVMFEAGAKSFAVGMLSYPKAAQSAGMPTEFIVYPKTGHNITIPRIQKESATRNLDWFRFWLKGEEDPDLAKAEQYVRWRTMRDERCAREDLDRASYCADNEG